MIFISQMLNEATPTGPLLFFFGQMITAISCCRRFVQNGALPRARDIVVAEFVRDVQQNRLLGNIEGWQIFRIFTVFIRLASSDECYEIITYVCKELSHKQVSLALA